MEKNMCVILNEIGLDSVTDSEKKMRGLGYFSKLILLFLETKTLILRRWETISLSWVSE